jgi:Family of unknown function (DUF6491)
MALGRYLFLLCAMTLPAVAQNVPPLTGTPCLQIANIAEYHPIASKRSLVVIDRLHKQYLLTFTAVCDGLQPHVNLGFSTFNPNQYSCLARGDSVYSSNDVGANRLCRIQTIEFYNTEPSAPAPVPGGRARG